ncbi:MAG: hypothetical protein P8L31_04900 [Pseudomonadales bacterium]|nr:hypothetical protein [Pseudomonadales bacterium]
MSDEVTANRGRRQLLSILSLALATLGGSYLLFYAVSANNSGWATTNNGEFVTPPRTTVELGWSLSVSDARHWWLWVVDQSCDGQCQQMVKDLRALHILLAREASRVRRAYTDVYGQQPDLGEIYPKLYRIPLGATAVPCGVYVVDPNGNLVFHYPMDANPKLILEDLKKLLNVSQIG